MENIIIIIVIIIMDLW